MQKGNLNGALRLLTNNMNNGILPLSDEAKHPKAKITNTEALLHCPKIHSVVYDIDEELILKATIKTKGVC